MFVCGQSFGRWFLLHSVSRSVSAFLFQGPREFVCGHVSALYFRVLFEDTWFSTCLEWLVPGAVQVVMLSGFACTTLFYRRRLFAVGTGHVFATVLFEGPSNGSDLRCFASCFSPLVDRAGGSTAPTACSTTWAKAGKGVLMGTACQTSRSSRRSFSTPRKYS